MSAGGWIIVALAGLSPLGAVAWVRRRFQPARMSRRADQLLADAKARMEQLDDAALAALFIDLGDSRSARRVDGLLDERRYAILQREWGDLWPELLRDGLSLDRAIDLGAAISVLAARHPAP
jgi:hypothetical protein